MVQVGHGSTFISDATGTSSSSNMNVDIHLHYITIGQPNFNSTFMDELCALYNLSSCIHRAHHDVAWEMVTQQALLDHCQLEPFRDSDTDIVAYIHSKGTYHVSEAQDRIRRTLTKYALSEQCLEELTGISPGSSSGENTNTNTNTQRCNVCGANFKSVWGPMYWGNMWSAKCSYVSKLVSPFDLERQNKIAVKDRPHALVMNLYDDISTLEVAMGRRRYAAEQFVGTHPSIKPCSFTKPEDAHGAFWSVDPPKPFSAHVVPIAGDRPPTLDGIVADKNKHLVEWYLLPGILWRYHVLYGEMPDSDSWIWRHYPDGERWREVVEEMGFPQALYHRIETEMTAPAKFELHQ